MNDTLGFYEEETSIIATSPIIPIFYDEWLNSGKDKDEIKNFFLQTDWITKELVDQTMIYAPQNKEIDIDSVTFSTIKSKLSFEQKCRLLFKGGHTFMNYRQLD